MLYEEYFEYLEFSLNYYLLISNAISYYRLLNEDKDSFTTMMHILNPIGSIV